MGGFKKTFQDRAGEQRHALKQPRACQRAETQDQFSSRGQDLPLIRSTPWPTSGIQRVFFVHPLQLRALLCTVLLATCPVTFPKT